MSGPTRDLHEASTRPTSPMTHDHLLAPPLLTLDEATMAMEATTDRCALLNQKGCIERTNSAWDRSTRQADPVALLSAQTGDDFLAACGRAALHGNRDAGSLHAQAKAILAGRSERAELTFSGAGGTCSAVVERIETDEDTFILVSFSTIHVADSRWTVVPEAGFSVPAGAPFSQLAVALDALHQHAVILDSRARIAAVNAAWQDFAKKNGGSKDTTGVGVSYLSVCASGADAGDERSREFLQGLHTVLRGEATTYHQDSYMSHGGEARRYRARATSMQLAEGRFTLVTHTDLGAQPVARARDAA